MWGGVWKEIKSFGLAKIKFVNQKRGRLGIRRIDLFNMALLVKWLWRMGSLESVEGCPRV